MRAWWGGAALTLALTLGLAEGARRSGALFIPAFRSRKHENETPAPSGEPSMGIVDRWFSFPGATFDEDYKDELLTVDER
jgi:hypothetical protein